VQISAESPHLRVGAAYQSARKWSRPVGPPEAVSRGAIISHMFLWVFNIRCCVHILLSSWPRTVSQPGFQKLDSLISTTLMSGCPSQQSSSLVRFMKILQTLNFLLFRSRTFLSLVAGAVAGVLGLTGVSGFLFYLIVMAAQSGTLLLKAKLNARAYFLSLQAVVFDGVLPNVLVSTRNKAVPCPHMLLSSGPICFECSKSCAKWVAVQVMQPAWGP
jgi:hypothetical protein